MGKTSLSVGPRPTANWMSGDSKQGPVMLCAFLQLFIFRSLSVSSLSYVFLLFYVLISFLYKKKFCYYYFFNSFSILKALSSLFTSTYCKVKNTHSLFFFFSFKSLKNVLLWKECIMISLFVHYCFTLVVPMMTVPHCSICTE